MSIDLKVLSLILVVHTLADFCLQTNEQAKLKSTDPKFLLYHVLTYSFTWCFVVPILFDSGVSMILFVIFNFITHYYTDFLTSRIQKPFWDKELYHDGFVGVAFDQLIHYSCLILSYEYLLKTNF